MSEHSTHNYYSADLTATGAPFYLTSDANAVASLLVIDHITIAVDPGAAAQTVTVTIGPTEFWKAMKLFDANAPDTIDVDFQNGLPCWNQVSSNVHHGKISLNTPISITSDGAPTSWTASILYHYERPSVRRS